MSIMPRIQSAGVGASEVDPIYRTSAYLNVGDEFEPRGMGLEVVSIPASRLRYGGFDPGTIAAALQGEGGEFSAHAPTIRETRRIVGTESLSVALAWTVTASAVRMHGRTDLDPNPADLDGFASMWGEVSPLMEGQILGATAAPLFVVENSPPVFQTAANASVGLATVSFASGQLNAATLVVAAGAIFVVHAAPIAGRAFGDYIADIISKLPGSNSRPE